MDAGTRTWQHNDLSESLNHHTIITQYHSTILRWAYFPPTSCLHHHCHKSCSLTGISAHLSNYWSRS